MWAFLQQPVTLSCFLLFIIGYVLCGIVSRRLDRKEKRSNHFRVRAALFGQLMSARLLAEELAPHNNDWRPTKTEVLEHETLERVDEWMYRLDTSAHKDGGP